MKKLFTMIRRGNLDKKPDLISCLAKAPPKKDDGQSPLMVAIKSDNLEVAHLLLDRGADVNFADAVNPYGINFSAPIWYDAIGQCFMRAGDHVSQAHKERTRGYFLLLRRLLDMGMDPNQKTSYVLMAWQHALEQYDEFARDSYPSYYVEQTKTRNCQLRELLYGLYGLNPDSSAFKPYTTTYRGKERLVTPYYTMEDYCQQYEIKWRELEPALRAYYKKAH